MFAMSAMFAGVCDYLPAAAQEPHRQRETTAMAAASLLPRRGKLLELAVHRAPRRLHRVGSRPEPSERRDQAPHPYARPGSDNSSHVHLRIREVVQLLYVHEAPPEVVALKIFRSRPRPPRCGNAIVMP
jgi:hypothetical protein